VLEDIVELKVGEVSEMADLINILNHLVLFRAFARHSYLKLERRKDEH